MWKFQDFSITQILRETNFGNSRSAKSTILTHLEALNRDYFDEFCTFWRLKCTKKTQLRAPKMAKAAVLELLDPPKLISRKT